MKYAILVCIAALAIAAQPAAAATVSIVSTRDTTIYGNAVGNSNGSGVQMLTGNDNTMPTALARRGLVQFQLPIGNGIGQIPAGSTITLVTLTMRLVGASGMGPTDTDVYLYPLTADWGEDTSDAGTMMMSGMGTGAEPLDATWNRRFFNAGPNWGSAGGDFDSTNNTRVQTINKTLEHKTWESPDMVADVQSWLDVPSANFGWIVTPGLSDTTAQTERRFATRDASDVDWRPTLTIEFTEPQPVPEPATWMLGLAGLALLGWVARFRSRGAAR